MANALWVTEWANPFFVLQRRRGHGQGGGLTGERRAAAGREGFARGGAERLAQTGLSSVRQRGRARQRARRGMEARGRAWRRRETRGVGVGGPGREDRGGHGDPRREAGSGWGRQGHRSGRRATRSGRGPELGKCAGIRGRVGDFGQPVKGWQRPLPGRGDRESPGAGPRRVQRPGWGFTAENQSDPGPLPRP